MNYLLTKIFENTFNKISILTKTKRFKQKKNLLALPCGAT